MTQLLDDPRYYVNEDKEMYDDFVSQYGEEAVEAFLDNFNTEDLKYFEDAYYGHYSSEKEFAEDYVDQMTDTRNVPELIMNNVDWDDVWADLRHDFLFENGYVFSRNW